MTATQSASFGFPANVLPFLRMAGIWLSKAMLAVAIVFVAGVIAVATATVGIALAMAALLMRVFGNHRDQTTSVHEKADGAGLTLEARKTPRGWTVE